MIMIILIALTSLFKITSGYSNSRSLRIVITAGLAILYVSLVIMVVWPEVVFLFFSWVRVSIFIALMFLAMPILVVLAILRNRFKEPQVLASLTLLIISVVYLLMLVLSAQFLYPMHVTNLKTRYRSHCSLENAWLVAKEFSKTYFNVYGINERVGFKLFPMIGEF